jgi:hypothetical protein
MQEVSGVLGGGSLPVQEWVDFLSEDYLADYLPAGGAAVKVAVAGSADAADRLATGLRRASAQADCTFVNVSAEDTKVHLVEQLFFAVARQLDWEAVAASVVRAAYDASAFPATTSLLVSDVAAAYDVDARELYRSVRRQLEQSLLGDVSLARELRRAVLRLAQAQLGHGDVDPAEHAAVLGWLRGEATSLAALRPALIHSRIGRHNARPLLLSLARLIRGAGASGLLIHLDLRRLAEGRRPPLEERTGTYYSKAAVLDAFEVLRQLIDATDELRSVLIIAVLPPELLTDESRGLPAYTALQLRVADEVRDRRRANPHAALVRLEVRLEAVA